MKQHRVNVPTQQKLHFFPIIFIGWVMFIGCYIISEVLQWTDKTRGLTSAIFHAIPYTFVFAMIPFPLMVLILSITRRRRMSLIRRILIVTSPVIVIGFLMVGGSINSAFNSESRFAAMMDYRLPETPVNFKAYHSGGGFADYLDMYYFETNPDEVKKLLDLRPYLLRDLPMSGSLPIGGVSPPPGWPNPVEWEGLKVFEFHERTWFYYILVDDNQTQVFVIAGCI